MLRSCVNVKVSELLVTETCLREHTLDCSPDEFCRSLGEDFARCGETLSSWISSVACVHTVGHLLALESNFLGVDYDNIVTAIHVRSESWLVLTAEDKGNPG